ncbi:hydantoinase/oxoprolinase family protein [Tsuneonella sp. YG55]|uniref:Hydantoinase/oxoprolinase family protein n=1 Tax=Tsuneonella litorea TaxID=2976475 RepID=A0A9X2VZ44_9SPHN|nr:hydantoinase/oxoprolinase family protein [Tsuneonella litorea]MCT2557519.1 hydantoinase/oxoprolinase family protein [Tsuneonella litorea]
MRFIVGVDIGGTFTDCVALKTSDDGSPPEVRIGKASSTPPDFQTGFINSLRTAAEMHGVSLQDMLANAQVYHGCTVGTNALVEHKTAKVGLLASRGHSDTTFIMKAGSRLKYMPAKYIAHVAAQTKPEPLVSKDLCEGIDERITFDGRVFAELNEDTARAAIRRLVDKGVEAIAISLIWSTANDAHEKRLRELVREIAPDLFVCISSEISPRVGEYERTIATIVNALIGPPMRNYLDALEVDLEQNGYTRSLQIMSCAGGLIDSDHAAEAPVLTVGSGPVAGLIGAASLAKTAEVGGGRNVITADIGGTTLDVGTIYDGKPVRRPTASYGQFEYFVPTLDVRSVGAGGGSIIRNETGILKVGPDSAGARPGPVCFNRGGTQPTVTDAAVVLGILDPAYFFGGQITLDVAGAEAALAQVGEPLGLDARETAAAAIQIINNQMADSIWLTLTQQGHDPREFILYGFGGGGGVHGAAIARELGLKTVVVPMSNLAAGWSAFGISASEALVTEQTGMGLASPFDPAAINAEWPALEERVRQKLIKQGVAPKDIVLKRFAELRYSLQINQVEVPAPDGEYDAGTVETLVQTFETEYERLYGKGSGFAAAGFGLTGLSVHGTARLSDLTVGEIAHGDENANADPVKGTRDIIWYGRGKEPEPARIYEGPRLGVGSTASGPAIIEYSDTTVVVPHDCTARIDTTGSVVIDLHDVA